MRDSATAVHHELLECYALIENLGRGVVYYGSARLKQDSPHWGRAVELGRQVAELLGCTTWSGGGPGMMEAATAGVLGTAVTCGAMLCCTVLLSSLTQFVLCCAVLCCAVLCCAVLCCAVLCCAVLCCAVLCCAVLCCAVLCLQRL